LTGAVRARTWTEPRVRSWWVLASALLALTLYVVGRQTVDWLRERRLIADGVPTAALVEQAGTMTTAARQQPDSICVLSFERPDGTRHRVSGVLPEHMERGIAIPVTQTVMIRVDPVDPDRWTDRTAPPPLTRQAVALAVALPLVGGLALVGAVQRRRAAGAWGDGPASAALVLDARQTPVAPRSRAVRCAPADSADNRVFTVFLPPGSAAVARGDVLWVVRPPGRPQPAYAVEWFARESGRVGSASGTALTTPA
jgi:hypothetical protein